MLDDFVDALVLLGKVGHQGERGAEGLVGNAVGDRGGVAAEETSVVLLEVLLQSAEVVGQDLLDEISADGFGVVVFDGLSAEVVDLLQDLVNTGHCVAIVAVKLELTANVAKDGVGLDDDALSIREFQVGEVGEGVETSVLHLLVGLGPVVDPLALNLLASVDILLQRLARKSKSDADGCCETANIPVSQSVLAIVVGHLDVDLARRESEQIFATWIQPSTYENRVFV